MVNAANPAPSPSATTGSASASNQQKPVSQPAQSGMPTLAQLKKICPQSDAKNLERYFPILAKEWVSAGMGSKNNLVAAIATTYVETRRFAPIEEEGKGGGRHGIFYGRGFIQLTWEDGYRRCGKAIGLDLVSNPNLALQPEVAAKIFTWYWTKGTSYDIRTFAEKGDWANVRSLVNAGTIGKIGICWGKDVYFPCIERAVAVLTAGLDPTAVGNADLGASYGLGCVDTGNAPINALSGMHNPSSGGDAILLALGLHLQALNREYYYHAYLNAQAQPDVIELEPQLTFEGKGSGEEFDKTFTVEEVIFYIDEILEVEVVAHAGDALPSNIQVFSNGAPSTTEALAQAGLSSGAADTAGTPGAAVSASGAGDGAIPGKIYAAAMAAYEAKRSSRAGPGGGNVACDWALHHFCLYPAGIKKIGDNPDYVPSTHAALKAGRGRKVSRAEAIPGDIWVAPNEGHIGVCTTAGCTKVLSNSSIKACFCWLGDIASVNSNYGSSTGEFLYRVLS
jgi:hypothetical protein